ncbi:MAG: hypothetical protein Q8N59_01180 [bacterium]|nr:hypothetical protein [bacterium]
MRKNGLGKTEKSILVFVKKQIGTKTFSPGDLLKAGYQGDKRTLGNTLPRLAKKGFLKRFCKGVYKAARPGKENVGKVKKPVLQAPRKKLTSEEWKMKISIHLEKVSQEIASCDKKSEMRAQDIKDAQAEIEDLKRQKKEFENELEKWRKIHDLYQKNPQGFGDYIELILELGK